MTYAGLIIGGILGMALCAMAIFAGSWLADVGKRAGKGQEITSS